MSCPQDCGRQDWIYCSGCAHGSHHPLQTAAWEHTVKTVRLVVSWCRDCESRNSEITEISPASEEPEGWWDSVPILEVMCSDCNSLNREYRSEPTEVCDWRCYGACCDFCEPRESHDDTQR